MKYSGHSGARLFLIIIMLISTSFILIFSSCQMPLQMASGGSLSISITSGVTEGSRTIETVRYVFSGTGPGGDTFSTESYEPTVIVDNLTAGEWTVQAAGYNSDDVLVVMGQSPMTVQVYGMTTIDIEMAPVEGEGNIRVSASWDPTHTVLPSAVAVITAADGSEISESLSVSNGYAEATVSTLPSGFYRVSIQLYDDGDLTAGSVWTVMVLNGITTEAATSFDNLNKTGERIVITDTAFSIAWDTDSSSDEYYRIYARARGTYEWTFIEEITAAPSPEFEVNTTKLSFGTWEFAVSAVEGGVESDLHTSMDDNADPVSGWYIDWIEI